jgi:hypothetical protein
MATPENSKVLSAHKAKILINGKEVGFLQSLSYSINFGVQGAKAIGTVETLEHQQTAYDVSGEASQYFLRKKIVSPESGDPLGAKTVLEVLESGTFDVDILDDVSKKPIRRLEECTLASESGGVTVGQLVTRRFAFQALRTR